MKTAVTRAAIRPRRAVFAASPDDGAIEFVKWIALVAMLIDHAGALLFDQGVSSAAYRIGRLSFPLFAFVLAYKLSVKRAGDAASILHTVKRMIVWAFISFGPFYLAMARIWTPNIFFTLGLGALACWVERLQLRLWHQWLAYLGIFAASFGCDYYAPGVFLIFSVYLLYRRPSQQGMAAVLLCCAGIAWLSSAWVLAAIPIAAATHLMRLKVVRVKWFFYAIYPLHLLIIALIAKSGMLH